MPATLPRIDQDVLSGIRIGDERSLERLFRESFPTLTQEAAEKLDAGAGAARVVEGAFKLLWGQRATFDTPESVERFLHNTVAECAARENKRRATLHRFEAGAHVQSSGRVKHEPTVDEAWEHLATALHAADSPEAHAAARAQVSNAYRHDAATHVASIGKRRVPLGLLGLGAGLAVLIGVPLLWVEKSGTEAAAKRALMSPDVRVVSTVTQQQAAVELLDGSKASIGADTKLVIAPDFGTTLRAVKLEGAAKFVVAPGQKHPFYVRTGDNSVTATGTTFVVYSYPDDQTMTVAVIEGSVTVKTKEESRDVAASKAVVVAKTGEMHDATTGELEEATAWTNNRFTVANRPLREALRQINRWYALDVRVADSTLLARPVSVDADLQSSRDAIAGLEKTGKLAFDYDEDKKMILRDAGAAPAKPAAPSRARRR
jgi:ferric-dicitrate binding protein FerR (iron transport regulator)